MISRGILLALVSLASGGSAWPQSFVDPAHIMSSLCGWDGIRFTNCGSGGAPAHALTGDKDLDRAIAICDAHPNHNTNAIPVWPPYDPAYKECNHVLDRWMQSDTARRTAEREAKEAADKSWLEEYVKGLNP